METKTEHQEKMDAWIVDMNGGRKERTACQEVTEANPEKTEPIPEIIQSTGDEAAVRSSGALKKRRKDQRLAAG
jgi:hypothetical protein